jgi:hypothetical protein
MRSVDIVQSFSVLLQALTTRHPLSAKVGTTPASSGRSVSIVRSRTKATEFSFTASGTYRTSGLKVLNVLHTVDNLCSINEINETFPKEVWRPISPLIPITCICFIQAWQHGTFGLAIKGPTFRRCFVTPR